MGRPACAVVDVQIEKKYVQLWLRSKNWSSQQHSSPQAPLTLDIIYGSPIFMEKPILLHWCLAVLTSMGSKFLFPWPGKWILLLSNFFLIRYTAAVLPPLLYNGNVGVEYWIRNLRWEREMSGRKTVTSHKGIVCMYCTLHPPALYSYITDFVSVDFLMHDSLVVCDLHHFQTNLT